MKYADRNPVQPEPAKPHVKPWNDTVREATYGANVDALTWAEAAPGLSPAESTVLSLIASRTRFRWWDGFRWSVAMISRWSGYGRTTVKAALSSLLLVGYLCRDGAVSVVGMVRKVVVYRVSGTPNHPLPVDVIKLRDPEMIFPAEQDQKPVSCEIDHKTKSNPPRGPVEIIKEPSAVQDQNPPRSAVGETSRYVPRANSEREIPIWATPVADRLTPSQARRITAIAEATMQREGIGPVRLAARVRAWQRATGDNPIRSPFGWLWHAVERRPYGCADPRCEDGDVWDGDRITGRCPGCAERRMDRAAAKRSGNPVEAPWKRPWVPVWVSERLEARRALTALLRPSGNRRD